MASSGLDVFITNVLMDISKFLDVESTVRLSQTCRTLHESLTDDPNSRYPKIKVSHFSIGDPSMWRDEDGNRLSFIATAGGRITSLSTHVLPKIHFPSLKRLEFRFPPGKAFANGDDEVRDLFVNLAIGLGTATNLEEFHIDIGLVMKFDTFNSRMIYEVFAKNLAKCTQLRRLKVFNHLLVRGGQSYYSVGFLRALVPAIERGVLMLEEVTLLIGNSPTMAPSSNIAYINATRDLFAAILRLRRLKEFNLQLNLASSPLLNEFLQVCEHLYRTTGTLPSESVEKFMVTSVLYKVPEGVPNPLPVPLSLAPCLALLNESSNLQAFVVRVPSACWDSNSISELKNVLSAKPMMRHLGLYFHGYECTSGRTLEYVLDYIQEREMCSDNLIHVSGLECCNTKFDEEEALDRYYSREGQKCLSWDENGLLFQAKGYMVGW